MEGGREEAVRKKTSHENDVVVTISSSEESADAKASVATEDVSKSFSKDSGASVELERLKSGAEMTPKFIPSSPDVSGSPTAGKPPKVPTEPVLRRRSLGRSAISKPKSRLLEALHPIETSAEERARLLPSSSPTTNRASVEIAATPRDNVKKVPGSPSKPLEEDDEEEEEEEEEEVYKTSYLPDTEKKRKKLRFVVVIELIAFVCLMGCLIASLTVHRLQHTRLGSLEIWKWFVLVLVVFCGRLVTEWCLNIIIFMIERNYLFRQKVLYFVHGLKKSVLVFIWFGLILLAWGLLIDGGVKRSRTTTRILKYVTRTLASCLIGAALWLVKALLIKLVASSFHVKRFFDRIQESLFHQYILQILSKPPSMENPEMVGRGNSTQLSLRHETKQKGGKKEDVVDIEKLYRMNQEKVSAWTMKGLMDVIQGSGLTTMSNALEGNVYGEGGENKDKEIASEREAKIAAIQIFENVAKTDRKYIHEVDLCRFMNKQMVDILLPLFEGSSETRKIKKSSFKKWVVNVYNERKSLTLSLNDAKTAIEELNRITSGILVIVIIIVWLLMMGWATTKVLIVISSQLLLVAFMFGNTCKTVFEAMIFVFVMHPFDVGDRCVIDGVQMVVEEMNILTTIFLRYDNEKIFYPNAVLATKPISNYFRSPEMGDSVEFAVDFSTSMETIAALKDRIKAYLESKPEHWSSAHSVLVKDIVKLNQMNIALYVNHTINFQNYGEKNIRRSELVIQLKKIFEELNIKYHLLPQEVQLRSVDSPPPIFQTTTR